MPAEVSAIMSEAFGEPELLFAVPEHKTAPPGVTRESQSDDLTVVRHPAWLAVYTIEGKVDEKFSPTVGSWRLNASPGKAERLAHAPRFRAKCSIADRNLECDPIALEVEVIALRTAILKLA
jgi:hypothetical protein